MKEHLYVVNVNLAIAIPEGDNPLSACDIVNILLTPLQREHGGRELIDFTVGYPYKSVTPVEPYDTDEGFSLEAAV